MSFLSADPNAPQEFRAPTSLDDAADRLAICGRLQATVALQAVLDVLAEDLLDRRAHVDDPGAERAGLSALADAVTQNRQRLADTGGAGTTRHALSSVWAWHSGALTWTELMATLVERVQKDLGLLIGDLPHVIEIDADSIDLADAFHAVLAALSPSVADQMNADAAAFLARWWRRLCERLPFRRALESELG